MWSKLQTWSDLRLCKYYETGSRRWKTGKPRVVVELTKPCYAKRSKLGNTDMVEIMLQSGHNANGSLKYQPRCRSCKTEPWGHNLNVSSHKGLIYLQKIALADDSQISLTEISTRPSTSRPGQFIANYFSCSDAVDGHNIASSVPTYNESTGLAR